MVRALTAALEMEYQAWKGIGSGPATELRFTMRPDPARRMWGSTARMVLFMPNRFTSIRRRASASSVNSNAPEMPKPALLMSTSIRPSRAQTSSTA